MIRGLLDLPNDDSRKIIFVAVTLCLVCSLMVSTAAVLLAPIQAAEKQESLRRNVLITAGLLDADDEDANVATLFARMEAQIVDLETGEFASNIDARTFDPVRARRDPALSGELDEDVDIAGIDRRERYIRVYIVRDGDKISRLVMPIRGRGLWSTLYAFIALEGDFDTVAAVNFYEHGETPGLADIDDPDWQAMWIGRHIYDAAGDPRLRVIRGRVNEQSPGAINELDGISGATLTGNGVSNLLAFWFGDMGYQTFLKNLRTQGA